jgi:hypothetical protein
MSRLSIHQNVFDLIGFEPPVSPEALRAIEDCEGRSQQLLPAAMRDWYVREKVVSLVPNSDTEWPDPNEEDHLWYDFSNGDHPLPLPQVLSEFERVNRPDVALTQRFVEIMVENQAVVRWFIQLDDSDDPPVWHNNDSDDQADWVCVSEHFSHFVFDWIAFYYTHAYGAWSPNRLVELWLQPRTGDLIAPPPWAESKRHTNGLWLRSPRESVLLPPHIDYLIDHLQEGPREVRSDGLITYHFTTPAARLHATTDPWQVVGGHSAWWLHADDAQALEDLALQVWNLGTLNETLTATCVSQQVLERLRHQGGETLPSCHPVGPSDA